MPELPEVETIARGLDKRVRGDAIESVWLGKYREPLKSTAKQIAGALTGSRIAKVRRVGKHIVFDLEPQTSPNGKSSSQWIVHLGMTGRMLVCSPGDETVKHTHAVASLSSGRELRFIDPRRFGRLSVATEQSFAGPGTEPLTIKLGGSSVSDYVDAEGREGFFQLQHRVYLRTGKPCLVCKTAIKRFVLGGRGTHYCPRCQR
jgi:formamidopyrimidine-DNA glycosylase